MSKLDSARARWNERYAEGKTPCAQSPTHDTPNIQKQMAGDPVDYTQHPFLYKHAVAKRLLGGEGEGNPSDPVAAQFFNPPIAKALAIGCGLAFFEEWLAICGHVETIDAFELSEVAVASAKARLAAAGLADRVRMNAGDVLKADLKPGSYDLVVVQAAIHHFFEIEEMFAFMHGMLKPGGLLFFDEYVGPDHMQYEPEVQAIMNQMDDCLAEQYRFDHIVQSQRTSPPYATVEQMVEMDASEGVHASEILPLTYRYFDVEYRGDYGGTIMRPFFTGILPNFDFEDARDQTIARLLILIEKLSIENRLVPNHHTRIVARRRETLHDPFGPEDKARMVFSGWTPPA
jgi:SAM-dependent methyltransferase